MSVMLLMCLFVTKPIYGATYLEYGDKIIDYSFSEELSSSTYDYFYWGKDSSCITSEDSYENKKSLRVDIADLKDKGIDLNFQTLSVKNNLNYDNNYLSFNIFSKGYTQKPENLVFVVYLKYEDGTTQNIKSFNEYYLDNGWIKNTCTLNMNNYDGVESFCIGILYYTSQDNSNLEYLYFDSIQAVITPTNIAINDITSYKNKINFDDIRIYGTNSDCTKKAIDTKHCDFEVESGNAVVEGRTIKINSMESEDVRIIVNFNEISSSFNIRYIPGIVYSSLNTDENNNYSINVQNNTSKSINSTMYIALYEGERLYTVKTSKCSLSANSSGLLSVKVDVPKMLDDSRLYVFFMDDLNGYYSPILK